MENTHIFNKQDKLLFNTMRSRIKAARLDKSHNEKREAFIKAGLFATVMSVLYYQMLFSDQWFIMVPSYILFGLCCMLITFNFSHELSHNTIFKKESSNQLFYVLSLMMAGAHAEGWKHRHLNAHHFAPNVEGFDPDLDLSNIIRVLPHSEHKWYHNFQHIYAPFAYMFYTLFWVFVKDFVIIASKRRRKYDLTPSIVISLIFQKAFYYGYLLVLPMILSPLGAGTVVLAFLLMHFIQSAFLLFTFFMTHHVEHTNYPQISDDGKIQESWVMNQIKSSNDMNPFSNTTTYLLGGFNNHIAHHLFPNIHHSQGVKVSKIIYEVLAENGIHPTYTSYIGGIRAHLRLLKSRSVA